MTGFALDAFPFSGDSDPSLYLIDLFVWASSDLSKDIEMPESVDTGFTALCGVLGAVYLTEDGDAVVLVIIEGTAWLSNKTSRLPDPSAESSKLVSNADCADSELEYWSNC